MRSSKGKRGLPLLLWTPAIPRYTIPPSALSKEELKTEGAPNTWFGAPHIPRLILTIHGANARGPLLCGRTRMDNQRDSNRIEPLEATAFSADEEA